MVWYGRDVRSERDGVTYHSLQEARLADRLHELKARGEIRAYTPHVKLPLGRKHCDFLVILKDGAPVWVELDGLEGSRLNDLKDKVHLYRRMRRTGLRVWWLFTPEEILEALRRDHPLPKVAAKREEYACGHTKTYRVMAKTSRRLVVKHKKRVCDACWGKVKASGRVSFSVFQTRVASSSSCNGPTSGATLEEP